MHKIWTFLNIGLASAALPANGATNGPQLQNANHVFNAIHSSMRQWGSSLNHNGMSLFIATVPKEIELYHGSHRSDRINGTEWLAFEPEHALVFAHMGGPPPGRGERPPKPRHHIGSDEDEGWHPPERMNGRPKYMPWHQGDLDEELQPAYEDRPLTHTAGQRERARLPAEQEPMVVEEDQTRGDSHGYLHTYRPRRDLRLLYIDGQSAAKSDKGTLDMQDLVLLHDNPPPKDGDHHPPLREEPPKGKHPRPGGPMNEAWRAEKLCEMAQKEWDGRVDGFLRMELGFEIILCSFERDLEVKRITQAKSSSRGGPGDHGESFTYYQAVASRFDGIGGNRVRINYDYFVTLFAAQDAVYFDKDDLPRARNVSDVLRPVQNAINEMILRKDDVELMDWQAVADMVIARYADKIEYLASGSLQDLQSFKAEIDRALRPFIDYGARNQSEEVLRCATQHVPQLPSPTHLAATSILNVTSTLCSTLFQAAEKTTYRDALETVQDLKSWLAWTTWKRCRGCGFHEVCFVPIWPMGSKEEHDNPRCVSNMSEISRGYWGRVGPKHSHKKELR